MLLAVEADAEAWTLPTGLAWSGGTYLKIKVEKEIAFYLSFFSK